jgi:hypothetical protein
MSTLSHIPDLHPRDLEPVVYGEHTLGTVLSGNIPEFTYTIGEHAHGMTHGDCIQDLIMIGGLVPSHVEDHGQVLRPRDLDSMASGERAR